MKTFSPQLAFLLLLAWASSSGRADEPVMPGVGFSADRYATLWKNSPFAIATPDAPAASTDYSLVGIAQFDGISYANLIEKQSQEHFVLSSDKPVKNLTLVSISRGTGTVKTTAVIRRNGEPLTLTLEEGPTGAPGGQAQAMPNGMAPQMGNPMISNNPSVGGIMFQNPTGHPPRPRFRRPPINIPPAPVSQ